MKKSFNIYLISGILFVFILGTLSHFFYEWSGYCSVVGLFCPVNESIWEHIKLVCFPTILYMILLAIIHNIRCNRDFAFYYDFHNKYPCIWGALCIGIITGSLFIPVCFYTYSGILGFSITAVDISIFFIAVLITFATAYYAGIRCKSYICCIVPFLIVLIEAAAFFYFTWNPPSIPLFISPV